MKKEPEIQAFGSNPGTLADEELLALILGAHSGDFNRGKHRAAGLLDRFGSLAALQKCSLEEFAALDDFVPEQARYLAACLELGWRLIQGKWPAGEAFQVSEQVYRFFRARLGRERVEVLWELLLDSRLRRIDAIEISRGAVGGTVVHPREVLRPAILKQAAAFILVHNHPSGDPSPSGEDLEMTRSISEAAGLFRIDLLDHVIIGHGAYYSMADHRRF